MEGHNQVAGYVDLSNWRSCVHVKTYDVFMKVPPPAKPSSTTVATAGTTGPMSTFDLFSSVRDGNTDIVRRLLQSKECRARLNNRNEWGDTALHLSAEAGNGEICQMLIAAGASVTVRNNRGETCLHRAAVGGHVASVRAIVEGREEDPEAVNSQNDAGYTALHHAAKHGSHELIEILVKAGADHMLQNNAGETPYMVARKFGQWNAERMLLDREQQHADRAIREMNRKEKDIIRSFLKAVKYASQLESRVRIMLIGDTGTGKSSLKKTIFGESYNPNERQSSGIHADPSVTRIAFKQYREWIQQPASKADTHRLNLEYIDVIIDYILNSLKQPRVVSDDGADPMDLQIEKGPSKNVNFLLSECVIPEREHSVSSSSSDLSQNGGDSTPQNRRRGSSDLKHKGDQILSEEPLLPHSPGTQRRKKEASRSRHRGTERKTPSSVKFSDEDGDSERGSTSDSGTETVSRRSSRREYDQDPEDDEDDDRLTRFAKMESHVHYDLDQPLPSSKSTSDSSSFQDSSLGSTTSPKRNRQSSSRNPPTAVTTNGVPPPDDTTVTQHTTAKPESTSPLFFSRPQRELSRLLVEKMPLEILKRMIIRWPVGEEQIRNHSVLNSNRLMITVWDISGDPLQQNFVPFFFSDRCIFVSTYNLSKNLDYPCDSHKKSELTNVDGSFLTNAQVLENWLGCVTAFRRETPSEPFHCTDQTPLLPPVIIACTHDDDPSVNNTPVTFHRFFERKSFATYKKHLVEASAPSALRLSNLSETISNRSEEEDSETPYCGHHILRREIDYLARQMPYVQDKIPVQWVKFEQLLYGLQQQKKLTLLYDDLARYVEEHCQLSGTLQVLPALAHFHDVGVIVHFYRHPELCNLVITDPQWLANALSSLITSNPGKWVTPEVQNAFANLGAKGEIKKDMLQLAYRCARMGQRLWNEFLFILNCMDLVCCHPSLHEKDAFYLPAMVITGAPDPYLIPGDNDPALIFFSAKNVAIPIALFNQLVVRCIRSTHYAPKLFFQFAHFQLNHEHHLLLWKEHTTLMCLVQPNTSLFCPHCTDSETRCEFNPECSSISHLISEKTEFMPTDHIVTLMDMSTNSGVDTKLHLCFSDKTDSLQQICSRVLTFLSKNLEFLCGCWFPGLNLDLCSHTSGSSSSNSSVEGGEKVCVLDQCWKHMELYPGNAPRNLQVWFD